MRACLASSSGVVEWLIIRKPDGLEAELAGEPEVLARDVGLGAVRGDPADLAAGVLGRADVVLGAEAGQHEEGDLGLLGRLHRGADQVELGRVAEAVVERRAAEAVAVGDLDDRHAGVVEGGHDVDDVLGRELVALGVRAVAQRRVGDAQVERRRCRASGRSLGTGMLRPPPVAAARTSPTRAAAAVMMSRLPAYGGKKSPAPSTSRKTATRAMPPLTSEGSSNCGSLVMR